MNKYQEALESVLENIDYKTYDVQTQCLVDIAFNTIQELVDKETPMKVVKFDNNIYCCRICGEILFNQEDEVKSFDEVVISYCPHCGQKLDWSDGK